MENSQIQIGDMIRIERFGYNHIGIYVGRRNYSEACVVHNCKGRGVMLSTLEEFSGNSPIFLHQQATVQHHERELIAQRALALLGTQYDLINFNCEHAANFAQRGVAVSPQIAGAAVIGFIACGLSVSNSPSASPAFLGKTNSIVSPNKRTQSAVNSKTTTTDSVKEYVEKSMADPQYDWKQPINFYGRVVDENDAAVVGANIHFTWNDLSEKGTSDADVLSDSNGFFSLKDRRGKAMSVTASKDGYYTYPSERGSSFEYANPANSLFTPDPNRPVVFHLRKKGAGADLIHGLKLLGSRIDGTLSYVDLSEGKNSLTPPGDLTVQCTRSEIGKDKRFDWTFTLGAPDGGLIESTDEFMLLAPEDGYQPTNQISHKVGDSDWVAGEKRKFYVKSQGGKHYARIEITIIPDYGQNAAYDLNWDLNPNSSRNLEPK